MNLNAFLNPGHLVLWVLVLGLFFPRFSLFAAWLFQGYPPNTLPWPVNFFAWLCFPRFLMAYYIYTDQGVGNLWFWAYLIAGTAGAFKESRFVHHRVIRRVTVSRDGRTTTMIEEQR